MKIFTGGEIIEGEIIAEEIIGLEGEIISILMSCQ